jgi:hypothetical protein
MGNAPRLFLYGVVAFSLCCWVIQLGGLSALQSSCNNASTSIANYAAQNNTQVAELFQQFAYLTDEYDDGYSPGCAYIFGLQWFLTWLLLVVLIAVAACAAGPNFALQSTGLAWGFIICIMTPLFWYLSSRYRAANWRLHYDPSPGWRALYSSGEVETRVQVTWAGYILESICCPLLLFGISAAMAHSHRRATHSESTLLDPKVPTSDNTSAGTAAIV